MTTTSDVPVTDGPHPATPAVDPGLTGLPNPRTASIEGANEVRLVGRVSGISEAHELPSGDSVVTLRLVVPREVHRPRQPSVDTIDVACWSPDTREGAAQVGVGGTAEVTGSLRRRFFRSGAGLQSRYEVEAQGVRPVAGADNGPV
ncbi:MAG TPA: single-stranded DNA-binding protein [Propionibacteriaceae bacterium]|nr:single-stranded DNA-binding protein [Propionibacteriaceae bacterium]